MGLKVHPRIVSIYLDSIYSGHIILIMCLDFLDWPTQNHSLGHTHRWGSLALDTPSTHLEPVDPTPSEVGKWGRFKTSEKKTRVL